MLCTYCVQARAQCYCPLLLLRAGMWLPQLFAFPSSNHLDEPPDLQKVLPGASQASVIMYVV